VFGGVAPGLLHWLNIPVVFGTINHSRRGGWKSWLAAFLSFGASLPEVLAKNDTLTPLWE
jgi:hypothetical protein